MKAKQDARKLSSMGKLDLRRRVVRAVVEQGVSKSAAAKLFGVSRTSVHYWVDLYNEHGEDSLTPKRTGRPRCSGRLKGYQAATIVNIIKERCPDQLKMPFALWTREAVRDLIERKFGIRYSLQWVSQCLRRWGFTPQKPVTRAYERDEEQIRDWINREYPAIRERAKREKATIYWEDETGLRSDDAVGRSYSPRGQTPVIRNTGRRFGCNVISAVNNSGKMRFRVFSGRFNQDVMIDFLERLVRDSKRKVIVIADGHPAHQGNRLEDWLEEHSSECELILLPRYAPELNPDELLNQDLKSNVFSTGRPRNRDELMSQTRSYLQSTQKRPDIVSAYFQEAHVNYAAE